MSAADPSSAVGQLESAALKRKARLEQLRAKRSKPGAGGDAEGAAGKDGGEDDAQLPKPVFRSYRPLHEGLKETELPDAAPGEVTDHVKEELEKEHEGVQIEKLDFTNLAPRKPDWDLKRDIAPKLAKLERRTQRAIAELVRERLREEDLANAVSAGANAARQLAEGDEEED